MIIGLIGKKIGMTREFMETGQSVPVTVIKVEKGRVLDVINKDKRGYNAVKIGFFKIKNSKLSKQIKFGQARTKQQPKIYKHFQIFSNLREPGRPVGVLFLDSIFEKMCELL